jgi:hypothetical protein
MVSPRRESREKILRVLTDLKLASKPAFA